MKITQITGWRLHYHVSRTMGGSTSTENCSLLHPECHDRVHRLRLSVSKPRLPQRGFEVLEPDDGKLSRPVLRGPGLSDRVRLLDLLGRS
jgi:hypothetical protein